jgi:hypothetical protein
MGALKACLWIHGLGCLLSVFTVFMPMSWFESLYTAFVRQSLPEGPELAYAVRVTSGMSVVLGGFYVLLALRPMEYGVLVPFSGWAMVFLGVVCGVAGVAAGMPAWWALGDAVWCLVFGTLIVVFWQRARLTSAGTATCPAQ